MLVFTGDKVFSAGNIGTSGADFLELGIGARPLSMGEAFTAEINDINSIYYNPAGLGSLKYPLLSIQHQELILDSRLEHFAVALPMYGGCAAFSNSLFWVPAFDKIDIDGNRAGEVNFYNGVATAAYGYDFGPLYAGGSIKYIYQRIDTLFLNSAAIDLGVLKGFYMYSPFDAPTKNFHIGMSLLNLGTPAGDDPLPRMMRLGASYKLTRQLGFNLDLVENFIELNDLYDFTYGFNESFRVNTGIEFNYLEIISLRGGYRFNDAGTYTLGLGFNYVVGDVTFNVDTSFTDSGVFGPVYTMNLTFKLIPTVVTVERMTDADTFYKEGIKFFIQDNLEESLKFFKKCQKANPYYKNIDKKIMDIEEILRLRKENIELEEKIKRGDAVKPKR